LVTVKVYDPGGRLEMVVEVPLPVVVTLPGFRVKIHMPVDGKPFNTTLPVATEHVVWVIGPTAGAVGVGEIATEVVAVVTPQPPDAAIV
jgi:hypothetical protein